MPTQERTWPYRGEYKVTGVLVNGSRFKAIHTDNIIHALGINLYRGTVWGKVNGKWTVVRRTYN